MLGVPVFHGQRRVATGMSETCRELREISHQVKMEEPPARVNRTEGSSCRLRCGALVGAALQAANIDATRVIKARLQLELLLDQPSGLADSRALETFSVIAHERDA